MGRETHPKEGIMLIDIAYIVAKISFYMGIGAVIAITVYAIARWKN